MAFYQLLLFRKGRYKRQVPTKYAQERKLKKNINRKRKQIDDATWNCCANLWAMPFTGCLSGIGALICLRNNHIAHQKLRILEERYRETFGEVIPRKREKRRGILKKLCGCVADPAVGDMFGSDSDSDSDDEGKDEKDEKRGKGKTSKKSGQGTEVVQPVSDVVDNAPTATLSYGRDDSSIQEVRIGSRGSGED